MNSPRFTLSPPAHAAELESFDSHHILRDLPKLPESPKSFSCHTYEKCAYNPFICHTSKKRVRKSFSCHTFSNFICGPSVHATCQPDREHTLTDLWSRLASAPETLPALAHLIKKHKTRYNQPCYRDRDAQEGPNYHD